MPDREGTTPNPFTYNGRDGVIDDGNGLYFMRARYYEPRLMRYIQKDTAVSGNMMHPSSLNRYAYVMGNPIQFVDPGGEILPIIIGMAVGVATEIAIDWATGEFNPLEDDWGAYLENNWVDLSVGAVLGGLGPAFTMAKNLKYFKLSKAVKGEKLLSWARRCELVNSAKKLKKFANWAEFANTADLVYDLYDGFQEHVPDAVVDWVDDAADATADWMEGAAEDSVDWVEGAGETVSGAAGTVYNFARSLL